MNFKLILWCLFAAGFALNAMADSGGRIRASRHFGCEDRNELERILEQLDEQCGGGSGHGGICSARGYKGSTVEKAVAACAAAGWSKSTCTQDVTCEGSSLCSSRGYKGSNVEKAIAACVTAGWSKITCTQEVTCEGRSLCSSRGYKGSDVEAAIAACAAAGWSKSTCAQDVTCD